MEKTTTTDIATLIEGMQSNPLRTALAATTLDTLGHEFLSFAVSQAIESNVLPEPMTDKSVAAPFLVLGMCNDTDLLRVTLGAYAVENGAPKDIVQSMLDIESEVASVAMLTSLAKMVA